MFKLIFSGYSQISLSAIPIFCNSKLYPSGLNWNEKFIIRAQIHVNGRIYLNTDITNRIVIKEKIEELNELAMFKRNGFIAIITSDRIGIEMVKYEAIPYIFTVDEKSLKLIYSMDNEKVHLLVDLTMFKSIELKYYDIVYWGEVDKNVMYSRIKESYKLLVSFFEKYRIYFQRRFSIYYFSNIKQQLNYALLDTSYAYKNHFVVLQSEEYMESKYCSFSETHELAHLILYELGKSVFIFEEGLPTLLSELLHKSNEIFNFNIKAKKALKNDYKECKVLQKLIFTTSKKLTDKVYYELAASFLFWMNKILGMDKILECYKKINIYNDYQTNVINFFKITGTEINEAEAQWRNYIMLN